MPWFPDIANPAFCETLHLRSLILERQRPGSSNKQRVLEPGSAEFLAALAAGSNSKRILHVGCGLSTIALCVAARATGGYLDCVDTDEEKQAIVCRYIEELGLSDYVEFFIAKPSDFILERDGYDFVLFTGEPEYYIEIFDLLRFTRAAIIVAYNALDDATNEYIKHVRQQPGIDSSTLPVGRGIEVSKILSWDAFNSGRKAYCNCEYSYSDGDSSYEVAGSSLPDLDSTSTADANGSLYGTPDDGQQSNSISSSYHYDETEHTQDEGTVSPTVSIGTSLEEESARIHAVDGDIPEFNDRDEDVSGDLSGQDDVLIEFVNDGLQTVMKIEGPDELILLADITIALTEAKVSVQGAKIDTKDNRVDDVFYIVDKETKGQVDLDKQECIRSKIMKKLVERRQMLARV